MTRLLLPVFALCLLAGCQSKKGAEFGKLTLDSQKPAEIKATVPAHGRGPLWRLRFSGVGMSNNPDPVGVTLTNFNSRPIEVVRGGGERATVGPRQSIEIYRGNLRGLYRVGRWRIPEFEISSQPDKACKIGLKFDTSALTRPMEIEIFAVRPEPPPPPPGK